MDYQSARARSDYRYAPMRSKIRDEIVSGEMKYLAGVEEPIIAEAVLEIGYVDLEVNVTTPEISSFEPKPGDLTPIVEYFCCVKGKDEWWMDGYIADNVASNNCNVDVDFSKDDWQEQLERDMFDTIVWYADIRGFSFDHPNEERRKNGQT